MLGRSRDLARTPYPQWGLLIDRITRTQLNLPGKTQKPHTASGFVGITRIDRIVWMTPHAAHKPSGILPTGSSSFRCRVKPSIPGCAARDYSLTRMEPT